jgi:hypothetical protein
MNSFALIGLAAIASLATASDDPSTNPTSAAPVLRSYEPVDSVVFRLPGPPSPVVPASIPRRALPIAPVAIASPLPSKLVPASIPPLPVVPNSAEPPAKPALPDEMKEQVAFYFQKYVGQWKEPDARKLLGAPLRTRAAYDEKNTANGKIYAFHDPTGRFREIELDFEGKTGTLRTVFAYPPKLSWQEMHRRWTGDVSAADAQQGRKFYSYANRRMDVLVDAQGRVISLGLY